jgi:hypothetical protein
MTMSDAQLRAMMANPPQMRQVVMPTDAARAEVEKVRDLQIRTEAAKLACQLLAGKAPAIRDWWAIAYSVECYIRGVESAPDPAAPL